MTRKCIVSAGVGQHRAQLSDVHCRKESKEPAKNPYGDEQSAIRKLSCNIARSAQDADSDGVADDDGDTESEAEDLQQAPTPAQRTRHFHR